MMVLLAFLIGVVAVLVGAALGVLLICLFDPQDTDTGGGGQR